MGVKSRVTTDQTESAVLYPKMLQVLKPSEPKTIPISVVNRLARELEFRAINSPCSHPAASPVAPMFFSLVALVFFQPRGLRDQNFCIHLKRSYCSYTKLGSSWADDNITYNDSNHLYSKDLGSSVDRPDQS